LKRLTTRGEQDIAIAPVQLITAIKIVCVINGSPGSTRSDKPPHIIRASQEFCRDTIPPQLLYSGKIKVTSTQINKFLPTRLAAFSIMSFA